MFLIFLFGLAVSLSPMTGLRGEDLASPVDLAMIFFSVAALPVCFQKAAVPVAAPYTHAIQNLFHQPVTQFLLLSIPLLMVTTLLNLGELHMQYSPLGRDALSLSASIFVSISICACLGSTYRKAFLASFLLSTCLIIFVYLGMALTSIGYNADGRFIGLATNPNQTALHSLVAIIGICFTISKMPPGLSGLKLIFLLTILASFFVGMASASDAFAGSALIIMAAIAFGVAEKLFGNKLQAFAALSFLTLSGIAAAALLNPNVIGDFSERIYDSVTLGNQDTDRILLWSNGLAAWLERPFFGNGIGAWSGASGPFGGIEAHNSFIDWMSMTGILGGLLYATLLMKIFRFPLRKEPVRYGIFFGLLLYISFGFFFRNPIYWLMMALIFNDYYALQPSKRLQRGFTQKFTTIPVGSV